MAISEGLNKPALQTSLKPDQTVDESAARRRVSDPSLHDAALEAAAILETARGFGRESSEVLRESLQGILTPKVIEEAVQSRAALAADCYLTGAAEMLKRVMGDISREPWTDFKAGSQELHQYRLARFRELIARYRRAYALEHQTVVEIPAGWKPLIDPDQAAAIIETVRQFGGYSVFTANLVEICEKAISAARV